METVDTRHLFNNNLKRLRKERGMTQAQLAGMIGKPTSYIGAIEASAKFPSADSIDSIALALNVDVYELFVTGAHARRVYNNEHINEYIDALQESLVMSTQRTIDTVCTTARKRYAVTALRA